MIGFGFINLSIDDLNSENKKDLREKKIKEYTNIFDVALTGDCDYEFIIEILKKIKSSN